MIQTLTMTDKTLEKEIRELRKRLEHLQAQKRKRQGSKKAKGNTRRGRPRVDPKRIEVARALAKDYPILDVALTTGIGKTTLYEHGISRYRLEAEASQVAKGKDVGPRLSPEKRF
jgi:DNA invertase Pin-like site-specific DNA recombinase